MTTSRNPDKFHMGFDGLINFYRGKIEPDAHAIPRRVNAGRRAQVYGEVYRYSQMRDRECRAGIETMAFEIDMSRSQFKWHLDALIRDEFVIRLEQSKGGRGRTSRYVATGKLAALNDILNRETLRVQEGLSRNPPRRDVNPPERGGEETIRDQPDQETKKDSGNQRSAPSYSPTDQRSLVTQLFGQLEHEMRSFDYSTSEADLEARIEEDRRNGKARPNPIPVEEARP